MRYTILNYILAFTLILFNSVCYSQQLDIEINETNKAGIKIRNLDNSSASATNLDFRNDVNSLFQLGITGHNNSFFNFQEETAYLFTLGGQNIPIAFATNGIERMRIDSEGRVGIGHNNSLSSLVSIYNDDAHKGKDALFIYQDSANSAIEIITNADNYPGLKITANNQSFGASIIADSSTALNLSSSAGNQYTMRVTQRGEGSGGFFEIDNSSSVSNTIAAFHNGSGLGIQATNTGSGGAARFSNSSSVSTLQVQNSGSGHALFVNGTAMRFDADPNWDTTSDRRLKKDIKKFEDGLDVVLEINPVFFRYNGLCGISPKKENVGIIAQEMEEVAPYMISKKDMALYPEDSDNQEVMKNVMTYNPTALPYILVNAVKTLNAKVSDQKSVIQNQNDLILNLMKRLEKLESQVSNKTIQ